MYNYILTKDVEDDLERIHDYGVAKFGIKQADKYYVYYSPMIGQKNSQFKI